MKKETETRERSPRPAGGVSLSRRGRRDLPVVALVLSWYNPDLHAGVVRAARDFGWNLDDHRCWGHHGVFLPKPGSYDGVIANTATDAVAEWVASVDVPVVRMLDDIAPSTHGRPADGIPTVVPDMGPSGPLALEHLLSLGMPHLAFLRFHQPNNENSIYHSFLRACRERGVVPRVIDFPKLAAGLSRDQMPDRAVFLRWLRRELTRLPLPCALMADSDTSAVQAIQQALGAGIRVPRDLAVLGTFDLRLVHQRLPISLSSVHVDFETVAYEAGRQLDAAVRGQAPPPRTVVPGVRLVGRQSTLAFHSDDPRVSKAVMTIRRDFARPLSLQMLAREAGMSPRALQQAFADHGIKPVRELLMECRLAAARTLLRESDLKLESVAWESGLGTATNLCRAIKKRFGVTPGELR